MFSLLGLHPVILCSPTAVELELPDNRTFHSSNMTAELLLNLIANIIERASAAYLRGDIELGDREHEALQILGRIPFNERFI